MRALIREHEDREDEVMTEPFIPWVEANIAWLTEGDGWTLVEDYQPPEEPAEEPGE